MRINLVFLIDFQDLLAEIHNIGIMFFLSQLIKTNKHLLARLSLFESFFHEVVL
jgi:hypothetical protein